MSRNISIRTFWDDDAKVWIVTSSDVPGLVIEADSWLSAIQEIELVLPDLIEMSGHTR
jgi:hypothetical protein